MLRLSFQKMQEMIIGRPPDLQIEQTGHELYHTTYEAVIHNDLCSGTTKSTTIRDGITFLETEIKFSQDTLVEMMSSAPQVGFGFCLKGNSAAHLEKINGISARLTIDYADRTAFIYANESSYGHQQFWSHAPLQAYYIHFSYASFLEMIKEASESLPPLFYTTLTKGGTPYFHFLPMSQEMIATCFQVQHNTFRGKSKEFFLEAKVLDLLAHLLDAIARPHNEQETSVRPLAKGEEERIDHCYRLLENNLTNPPSLIKLAKESGLSVYRLKTGLRLRYGNTPFKLLTEMRMLKAKELLLRGEFNISEVAQEVGYSSIGSFSNTFFERFGVRPSTYKKV